MRSSPAIGSGKAAPPPRAACSAVSVSLRTLNKGVDVLIDAWKKVAAEDSQAVLIVVGPDTFDEVQSHLNEFASQTKEMVERTLEGRVIFTGMTDKVHDYLGV